MRVVSMVVAVLLSGIASVAGAQVDYGQRPPPPQYEPDYGQQAISCGSPQHRLMRCAVPGHWRDARLVRQTSHAACVEGQTWGFDRGGIWVDRGCGGEFMAASGWRPGPGWNHDFSVSCGSPQYRHYFCQVDVGGRGRVILQRQMSDSRCVEGRTWGWNRAGIWVDKGCGGQFLVTRRW